MGKEAFNTRKCLLSRGMDRDLKKRMIKSLVWSVALYGAETWTLGKESIQKLEAFEMWLWRRMEKISYVEHISNEKVLERVGESRTLLSTIRRRQKNWMGHVLRGKGLVQDLIEGRMEGKRPRGRPRMGMLDYLKGEGSYWDLKRRAEDRDGFRSWNP